MEKEEKKVTIVTAYFDIGRKNFSDSPRTNEMYAEYFKFWARIKNNIVVYTDSKMAKCVKEIRQEFNLLDKTKVIVIDDPSTIEPNLLNKMSLIENNSAFLNYRYMNNSADNNARYDYIMLLKAWCIKDAAEKGYVSGLVAWLDFGFNHGGTVYTNSEEFNYLWKAPVNSKKITMYAIKSDDNKPVFQIVESYEVYMMGAPYIVPSELASTFWNLIKESVNSLLDCGFIDDDQTLMLMAYRKNPDIFDIKISDWFMPLKECGGSHLTYKINKPHQTFKDKLLFKYRVNKRNKKHIKNLKKIFNKNYLD